MLYNLDEGDFHPCVHGRKQYIYPSICPIIGFTLEAKVETQQLMYTSVMIYFSHIIMGE